jgi:hypothetical protein
MDPRQENKGRILFTRVTPSMSAAVNLVLARERRTRPLRYTLGEYLRELVAADLARRGLDAEPMVRTETP